MGSEMCIRDSFLIFGVRRLRSGRAYSNVKRDLYIDLQLASGRLMTMTVGSVDRATRKAKPGSTGADVI